MSGGDTCRAKRLHQRDFDVSAEAQWRCETSVDDVQQCCPVILSSPDRGLTTCRGAAFLRYVKMQLPPERFP